MHAGLHLRELTTGFSAVIIIMLAMNDDIMARNHKMTVFNSKAAHFKSDCYLVRKFYMHINTCNFLTVIMS